MKNLKTFENFKQLEGVADKYAQREFNIPDTTNKYINEDEEEKPFGYVNGSGFNDIRYSTPVYKNPKSLDNFEPNVRVIVDIDGNLYVAKEDNPFSHGWMNKEIKLTNNNIYDDPNFLLLNRIEETNDFGFSSSGYRRIEGKSKSNIDKIIIDILKKVKKKNSNFDFYISKASPRFISNKNKITI